MKKILALAAALAVAITVLVVVRVEAAPNGEGDECGDLSEEQCTNLRALVSTWNEEFDGGVSIDNWVYKGLLHDNIIFHDENDFNSIAFNDSEIWIPVHGPDGRVSGAVRLDDVLSDDQYDEEEATRWRDWYRRVLFFLFLPDDRGFAELSSGDSQTHVVNLEWSGDFTTSLVIREEDRGDNTHLYLYDSMSLGVVKESISNSCIDLKLNWLWGGLRGQIRFDLNCNETMCSIQDPPPVAYLNFGDAKLLFSGEDGKIEDDEAIDHEGCSCEVVYSYAYATPLARISFDRASFDLEISGLGTSSLLENLVCARKFSE